MDTEKFDELMRQAAEHYPEQTDADAGWQLLLSKFDQATSSPTQLLPDCRL
ncbi:hypothetical protein [Hymenobacter cellulosivorans]|uniref:Uncharacterized protein n=1 Tax=Hymenobacter cellulosivorans TaxID=2932249 RepID=A0ABY4FD23_9BACT|nr:hypothetical protein [Hymenobacter cellulosivorans]UOQ54320.1 hypothetical protein MUN80_06065 [Hymenobacter cellulosivorans]